MDINTTFIGTSTFRVKLVSATGTVNVGVSSSSINIGNSEPSDIIIGNTGGVVTIKGNTISIRGGVSMAALIGATGEGILSLGATNMNIGRNTNVINVGNTGTAIYGSVNVGRSASTINIGGNVESAVTLGSSTGSVTLGPALTLGAAPTGASQLGGVETLTLSLGANATVTTTNSPYGTGSFTFSTPGTWIVNYTIQSTTGTINSSIQGWVSIIPRTDDFSLGSSTAPIVGSDVLITPNYLQFASGSFVTTITASVTFDMFIYLYSGSFFTQKSRYIVTFTRIG